LFLVDEHGFIWCRHHGQRSIRRLWGWAIPPAHAAAQNANQQEPTQHAGHHKQHQHKIALEILECCITKNHRFFLRCYNGEDVNDVGNILDDDDVS
jgi:hypothetical protein